MRNGIEHGIMGDHGDEGPRNSFPVWRRSSCSAKACKRLFVDRAQSTRSGGRYPEIIHSASNESRTKSVHLASGAGRQRSRSRSRRIKTLRRHVWKITKMPAQLPMTEVQTLHHQLKAARDNSDNQEKQQQSCEFKMNLSETSRFLDGRNSAHQDSHMLRQKTKMRQRKTIDGTDAALKSDKDVLKFSTLLPGSYFLNS